MRRGGISISDDPERDEADVDAEDTERSFSCVRGKRGSGAVENGPFCEWSVEPGWAREGE